MAAGSRPDRLNCRALVTALSVSAGPATDRRHVVLQPTMIGYGLLAIENIISICLVDKNAVVDFCYIYLEFFVFFFTFLIGLLSN